MKWLCLRGNSCNYQREADSLLEAQVADVSLIDPDDAVVLLEETLLLGFASLLQAFH